MSRAEAFDLENAEDMYELLIALNVFFGSRKLTKTGDSALNELAGIGARQHKIYSEFFDWMQPMLGESESAVAAFFNHIPAKVAQEPIITSEPGAIPTAELRSNLPVVTQASYLDLKKKLGSERPMIHGKDRADFGAIVLAFLLDRTTLPDTALRNLNRYAQIAYHLDKAVALVSSLRRSNALPVEAQSRLEEMQRKYIEVGASVEAMWKNFDETSKGFEKQTASVAEHLDMNIRRAADAEKEVETLREEVVQAMKSVAAHKAAFLEESGLSATKDVWEGRETEARKAFYASGTVLILAILVVIICTIVLSQSIVQYIWNIEQTGVSELAEASTGDGLSPLNLSVIMVSRLALVALPLAMVVWLLRLIARFNLRSLLLMDDARQRVSILRTYLFLISQGAAEKSDRAAVLEALFRRAPGHGPDTVEPPDFIDLLKLNQIKSPGS